MQMMCPLDSSSQSHPLSLVSVFQVAVEATDPLDVFLGGRILAFLSSCCPWIQALHLWLHGNSQGCGAGYWWLRCAWPALGQRLLQLKGIHRQEAHSPRNCCQAVKATVLYPKMKHE